MNKNTLSLSVLALSLVFSFIFTSHVGAMAGPLRVSTVNPRYFTDGSGKAIYLTGSHTWNSLQDMNNFWFTPNLISNQGFNAYLDFLQANNHNFVRMWLVEQAWDAADGSTVSPHPWPRTGPGTALDGKLKFDLNKFDQAYYDRLRQRVIAAGDKGIYVSVMFFGGMWGTEHANTWKGHPFNGFNNINGINADLNGDGLGDGTNELYTLQEPAAALAAQKAHVRKVIDTLNDLDNVLYEVANEVRDYNTNWQYEIINTVKNYEASKLRQHPVGMTGYNIIPNSDLLNSGAEWISPSPQTGADYMNNPPAASGQKVIIVDTDHLWGEGGDAPWVWKSFARGLNPIWMERVKMSSGDLPNADTIRKAMGYTNTYAKKVNLASMTPQGALTSTGYALANPGTEYLIYQPISNTTFTVNLASGNYSYEWFNPTTGVIAQTGAITGGATKSFTAPFSGDAVLYLKATTPGTTSSCSNLLNSTLAVPASFAASFNWFASAKELLMNVICSGSAATANIGNGSNTQYIWKTGYVWQNGQWTSFNYSGSSMDSGGNWFIGSANHSLGTLDLTQKQSVLSYICEWTNNAWKCGCHDNICSTGYWNLQQFKQ